MRPVLRTCGVDDTVRLRGSPAVADLPRGGNVALSGAAIDVRVAGMPADAAHVVVLQLAADHRVRSDDDVVFYNQSRSPDGAVELAADDRVQIRLRQVAADVVVVAIGVALDDDAPGSLAGADDLRAVVHDSATTHRASAVDLTVERFVVLAEAYRRDAGWKVRSVGTGWSDGLGGVLRRFGVDIEEAPPPASALPHDMLEQVDLRKALVQHVLLTKNADSLRARVVLVIDKTRSMHREYRRRAVHQVVERMVPVAVQLDDDGVLQCYLYARSFARLPDLRVADLGWWPDAFLHLRGTHHGIDYGPIGEANDERPIMGEIMASLKPNDPVPTLVLFFTDGGFHHRRDIAELMRAAAHLPAFWQFVGMGHADYGVLERLDEMSGRVVDNAGFFAVDDIDQIADDELYRRLLSEFPRWVRAARAAGVVG
jgi:stress response protein SCP2